jgi:hypothetical protein
LAYFTTATAKTQLGLTVTTYDTLIGTHWGPDGDDEIDNILAAAGISVPLSTTPDVIARASHQYIRYRFHEYLEHADEAREARKIFEDIVKDYAKRILQSSTGLIVKSQGYRTYPLNPDATPYRSITGSNNSTDDSDL